MVCYNKNNIFCIGGRNTIYLDTVRKYDLDKDIWVSMKPMNKARSFFGT